MEPLRRLFMCVLGRLLIYYRGPAEAASSCHLLRTNPLSKEGPHTRSFLRVLRCVSFLNQIFDTLCEARGRGAVDDIMIKTDGHTHDLMHFHPAIRDDRFFGDAAQRELQGVVGDRYSPA